jgi:hypothetical protein
LSARALERALARLAEPGALLAPQASGGFGVFASADRRRRALAKLTAAQVRELEADGMLAAASGGAFVLSEAGRSRLRRAAAPEAERFAAQHGTIADRFLIDADGDVRVARGYERSPTLRKLRALRDGAGAPWLSDEELRAAARLRRHWEEGQAGLVRGSDLSAPPMGSSARGPSSAQERALAARCDARRRVGEALDALAPPLRRVVERVCLHEDGVEALERAEGWPARSGKVALKLGLAQLARAF